MGYLFIGLNIIVALKCSNGEAKISPTELGLNLLEYHRLRPVWKNNDVGPVQALSRN